MSDYGEAIEAIIAAETAARWADQGLTLTEWILVASTAGWNGSGEPLSQVVVVTSLGTATHRVWGLLRTADARYVQDEILDAVTEEPPDE